MDDNAAEVLQPRDGPFDDPTPLVTSQRSPVLQGRALAAGTVRTDQFDPTRPECDSQPVGVVSLVGEQDDMVCKHTVGDYFELCGENLRFPPDQTFSMYALAALLPLLPAKQRMTHDNDWMTTDTDVACPDPYCGARFRITRTGTSTFRRSETTVVPLPGADD